MSMDQQDDSSFEDGFNSVADPDYVPTESAADAAGEAGQVEGAVTDEGQDSAADAGAAGDESKGATSEAADATDQGDTPADGGDDGADGADTAIEGNAGGDDEQEVWGGFTASQLKNLLSRASEVDGIKESLRKAHGHIGELNGRLRKHPAGGVPGAQFAGLDGEAFDKAVSDVMERGQIAPAAYGDFDEAGITRGTVATVMRVLQQMGVSPPQAAAAEPPTPAQVSEPPAAAPTEAPAQAPGIEGASATASEMDLEVERRVLDRVRPDWRSTVSGQDFNLWLASQDEAYQQTYRQANTADEFAGVLDKFDQWTTARQSAAARSTQAQQRLAKAITPSGHAARPQKTQTEDEAFEAGFASVVRR